MKQPQYSLSHLSHSTIDATEVVRYPSLRRRVMRTETQSEPVSIGSFPVPIEDDSWPMLLLVARRKRFLLRFVGAFVVIASAAAFLLPVRYEARVLLLPPQQNSSIGNSLISQLGGAASLGALGMLAGNSLGIKNPADMYVSLLTSRTVEDAVIQRFDLQKEYGDKRLSDVRKKLESRTDVVAGVKDGLIRLSVEDSDPKRAADLANGYIEEFRRLSESLAITEAARRGRFFEQQLEHAKNELTKAEDALRATQQSTGVLQIDSQARALIEGAAILRAQVVSKQVEIQSMRSFATDDNPKLALAKQELAAMQAQLSRLAGSQSDNGSDINLSKGRVTEAGMEYLRRYRELKYAETVFELLAKELEVAKLDEAKEGSIVQVVDPATVPDKRSFPPRIPLILLAAVLSVVIGVLWIVGSEHCWGSPEGQIRLQALQRAVRE
jgi:tyrosine-protein kinase Etk/Wzc